MKPKPKLFWASLLTVLLTAGCAAPEWMVRRVAPVDVIAFGSCAQQDLPQPIWDAVLASAPDLFIFLGDNIYGDTQDVAVLREKYALLGQQAGYQRLKAQADILATWDDHDYGANDIGVENPIKVESKTAFLDFFGEPAYSHRRAQEGGVYAAYRYGPEGRRVQILLLDTRWDRSPLNRVTDEQKAFRAAQDIGPYQATTDPEARILGEEQWRWLEAQLRAPADLRLIGTSIPFLQDGTGWETWANFPAERARLVRLIEETQANGVIFITGDTHRAQFSKVTAGVPYPLWEVDSSGLTQNSPRVAPDKNRLGAAFTDDNYGLIKVDWSKADPDVTMEIRDVNNHLVMQNTVRLTVGASQ
ncbi:MAG: alkaline phosphatase family protein [Anaerolineales bacterium]|nr:alkaline phosphatase family protein [Anaerolineales bacterium]